MTTIDYNAQPTTIPQTPKKADRLVLSLEEVFFMPKTMVHMVEPDPDAICISIRDKDSHANIYHPELKALYLAEGVPYEITDPKEQKAYIHPPLKQHYAKDRVYIKKQLVLGTTEFLRANTSAKRLYVNCSLGETRSYALACAVAFYMGFEPKPFEDHKRDENAWTNHDLQGAFEMMMDRNFKEPKFAQG